MSRIVHDRSHVGLRSSSPFWCHWCGSNKNLRRCGRCHNAFYCCKEHQRQHWRVHKEHCLESFKKTQNVYSTASDVGLSAFSRSTSSPAAHREKFQFTPTQTSDEISVLENGQPFGLDLVNLLNNSELPLDLKDDDYESFNVNPADTELFDEEVLSCLINGDVDFSDKPLVATDQSETQTHLDVSDRHLTGIVANCRNNALVKCGNHPVRAAGNQTDNQSESQSTYYSECNLLNDLNFEELNTSINECLDLASYHYGINRSKDLNTVDREKSGSPCNNSVTTKPEIRKTDSIQRQNLIENWENSSPGKTGRKPIVHEVYNLCESRKDSWFVEMKADPQTKLSESWLEKVCANIIEDMNHFGICVIDNFLGLKTGESILDEVKALYGDGHFREGQLVSSKKQCSPQIIRGDSITWVDGTEDSCQNIGHLIHTLDAIVMKCTSMKNNGLLKEHHINRRTKAMIACYPGNGTRYVKHVDNPNQDGRCITSIYYLNKNWDVNIHGGLLRMFPVGHNNHVANIEPLFDRILFFWSDRRNPHEVQPAFAVRFAITVWYCDSNERIQAVKHYNETTSI